MSFVSFTKRKYIESVLYLFSHITTIMENHMLLISNILINSVLHTARHLRMNNITQAYSVGTKDSTLRGNAYYRLTSQCSWGYKGQRDTRAKFRFWYLHLDFVRHYDCTIFQVRYWLWFDRSMFLICQLNSCDNASPYAITFVLWFDYTTNRFIALSFWIHRLAWIMENIHPPTPF